MMQSLVPSYARIAKASPWEGKTLLVDLDGTLINSRRREDSGVYELHTVRREAFPSLERVRLSLANCVLTSGGLDGYVEEMLTDSGMSRLMDRVFTRGDLKVKEKIVDGKLYCTPKDYGDVLRTLGESDHLANCAIIGNDQGIDVPINPKGVVTAISDMSVHLDNVLAYLQWLLEIGNSSFANGFDRAVESAIATPGVKMLKTLSWVFDEKDVGPARVMLFSNQ